MSTLLLFLLTGAVVAAAGTVLARNGDVIAARTRLGGLWVGSLFLALATSLPEISTDIAAVRIGQPDLAGGDLFGSSMANMLILALVTLLPAGRDLFTRATIDHVLYVALAIVLTSVAAAMILVRPNVALGGIGPGSLVILVIFLIGTRAIFRHTALARVAGITAEMGAVRDGEVAAPVTADNTSTPAAAGRASTPALPSLRGAVLRFLAASLVIVLAAPQFARTAHEIAVLTGLGSTFVGTWLVGMSTSLPELVTSLAAVRLGAYDLAAGNLFGSNAFNMTAFVILDAVHHGPILSHIDQAHAVSALVAITLMSTGLAALVFRARRRLTLLEPSSGAMLLIYLAGLALVYASTR